jgi:hypothetical protein
VERLTRDGVPLPRRRLGPLPGGQVVGAHHQAAGDEEAAGAAHEAAGGAAVA